MRRQYADPIFAREKVRRVRRWPVVTALMLIIVITGLALVNGFINRQVQLIRQSVTIPSLSGDLEGFRILHISDLHGAVFAHGQEGIEKALLSVRYNAVVITGDSLPEDGNDAPLMELIALLDRTVPVFLVAGDEDPLPIQSAPHETGGVKASYIERAESFGAVYLDAPYPITVGRSVLWLCPAYVYDTDIANARRSMQDTRRSLLSAPEDASSAASLAAVDYYLDRIDRAEAALLQMKSGDYKICVTHAPYPDEGLAELRYNVSEGLINNARPVSLVLAGHYNNGQFLLPGLGAVRVPARLGLSGQDAWFFRKPLSGLDTLYGISQYISPGLGAAQIYAPFSVRFLNPPAITLITLTSKLVY